MDKRTWQLFVRTWLKPFVIALIVLMIICSGYLFVRHYDDISAWRLPLLALDAGINSTTIAVFLVSSFAGWRLGRYWWQLPLRLLPGFLRLIAGLALISFLLIVLVKPNGSPQPSGYGLFSLRTAGHSLDKKLLVPRQQLIDYMGLHLTREQAFETVWMDSLKALHIGEEEINWRSIAQAAGPSHAYSLLKIDSLFGEVRKVQTQIDLNTEQQWRYYQHPVYMVLLFALGLFIGATFCRRGLLGLIIFAPPIYYLYRLIGQGLENAAKKDNFAPWFIYLLPISVGAAACIILYIFLRTAFDPASETERITLH